MDLEPVLNDPDRPLVTVCIFNYNYGRYLSQCLDSVFAQTYRNIEICFSDNASTDDSWDIALEYARNYPGVMTITRNRNNFGVLANWLNCKLNIRGKYYLQLCSDDAMKPEYIEKCVRALEAHPCAGFAMVNRNIIDENGFVTAEPPFYNRSCIVPGPEQAAVYMMAAVNPSVSQIVYNKNVAYDKFVGEGLASRWYRQRIIDFVVCCESPIVYIKEPLLLHRLHSQNDSFSASDVLMEVIGPYVLQHQFADIARHKDNLSKVVDRLPESLNKLSKLCLRYCIRALVGKDERKALRYFHLAVAISPDVMDDSIFTKLQEYWKTDNPGKSDILASLQSASNLTTRSVSYDPPPGSTPIEVKGNEA